MTAAQEDRHQVADCVALLMHSFDDEDGTGGGDGETPGTVSPRLLEARLPVIVGQLRNAANTEGASLLAIVNENSPVRLSVFGLATDLSVDMREQLDAFDAVGDALHDVTSRARKRRRELNDLLGQAENKAKSLNQLAKASNIGLRERRSLPDKLSANKRTLRDYASAISAHTTEAEAMAKVIEMVVRQTADNVTTND